MTSVNILIVENKEEEEEEEKKSTTDNEKTPLFSRCHWYGHIFKFL